MVELENGEQFLWILSLLWLIKLKSVILGKLETVIFILTKLQNVDITEGDGINAQNNNGKTALFYAKDSHMMYLLLHYGADPCITRMISNSGHESVLEYYMKTNPENAIALLNFDVGTNIRDTTDDKCRCLSITISRMLSLSIFGNHWIIPNWEPSTRQWSN